MSLRQDCVAPLSLFKVRGHALLSKKCQIISVFSYWGGIITKPLYRLQREGLSQPCLFKLSSSFTVLQICLTLCGAQFGLVPPSAFPCLGHGSAGHHTLPRVTTYRSWSGQALLSALLPFVNVDSHYKCNMQT